MDMRAEADMDPSKRRSHHLRCVPVVALMPHSRCNCRCLMCDIWKGNRTGGVSWSTDLIARLTEELRELGVEEILLTGGEPMMHPRMWQLCAILKSLPIRITLLSTGLLLPRYARDATTWCDDVIVSLDGSEQVHDHIRGIAHAFARLANGVAALRQAKPGFPVSGRCVLQKHNFRDLPQIIRAAHQIGLDRISFLSADLSSSAFNRPERWDGDHVARVCLDIEESKEFVDIIEAAVAEHSDDITSGFIMEPPDRLRRLAQYYLAANGVRDFPAVRCEAPWVSTVIETDGTVRPCFFHAPIGNIHEGGLNTILNSAKAVAFRKELNISSDPTCSRCVCTYNR